MFPSKAILFTITSIFAMVLPGTLTIPSPLQQQNDLLEERVIALETEVTALSEANTALEERVAALEEVMLFAAALEAEFATDETETEVVATPTPTGPYEPLFADYAPFDCEYAEFQDITFCSALNTENFPQLDLSPLRQGKDIASIGVYVGDNDETLYFRWDITYIGDDWLFLDEVVFLVDGERFVLPIERYRDVNSDTLDGGLVYEEVDTNVEDFQLLVDIALAEEVKVRLGGSEGVFDKTLDEHDLEIIRRALATYEQRGGRLPTHE